MKADYAKEVIRVTERQKRFLDSIKITKSQSYNEVLENIIGDYKLFQKNKK